MNNISAEFEICLTVRLYYLLSMGQRLAAGRGYIIPGAFILYLYRVEELKFCPGLISLLAPLWDRLVPRSRLFYGFDVKVEGRRKGSASYCKSNIVSVIDHAQLLSASRSRIDATRLLFTSSR